MKTSLNFQKFHYHRNDNDDDSTRLTENEKILLFALQNWINKEENENFFPYYIIFMCCI